MENLKKEKFKGYSDGKSNFHSTRHRKNRRVRKPPSTEGTKVIEYDVHEWTTGQVRDMLKSRIKELKGKNALLYVCYGRGKHSDIEAKLGPLITDLCVKYELRYWYQAESKGGALYVEFDNQDRSNTAKALEKRFRQLDISPERVKALRIEKTQKKKERKKEKRVRDLKKRKKTENRKHARKMKRAS